MKDDFVSEQQAHEKAMAISNARFLDALRGEGTGGGLIWRGNHMPLVEGPTIKTVYHVAERHKAQKAQIDALRVNRGVCPRCGANTAKGCRHVS